MKSKSKSVDAKSSAYDPCKGRPYNRYNIYYILERELFLQTNFNYKSKTRDCPSSFLTGYEDLTLPSLPPRYENLKLADDWYMPGKRKAAKRRHTKSHGAVSFQTLARVVADGWRAIDDVTLAYCTSAARIMKQRHDELKKIRRLECVNTTGVINCDALVSPLSKKKKPSALLEPVFKPHPRQTASWTLPSINNKPEALLEPRSSQSASWKPPSTMAMTDFVIGSPTTNPAVVSDFVVVPPTSNAVVFNKRDEGSDARFDNLLSKKDDPLIPELFMCALDTVSVDNSVHSEVDISDQDILAMWHSTQTRFCASL